MAKKKDEIVDLGDLKPSPINPRKHNPRNIGMVVDSIQEFGFLDPIIIDEDNTIVHGHGRFDAAAEVGMMRTRIIETDGDEVLAIRRKGLTPQQKLLYGIKSNRSSDLAGWDKPVLDAIKEDGIDLSMIWTDKEYARIPDMAVPVLDAPMFDDAPPPEQPQTQRVSDVVRSVDFTAEQWETIGSALDRYRSRTENLVADSDILAAICSEYLDKN